MKWCKVTIGDFLIRVKNLIPIEKEKEYSLVTIKLYHKGVQLRKKVPGSYIQAEKMSRVEAGQFILSGIDARNGAFGIVPAELDGAVVTNDFWHFNIDKSIVSDEYFLWLTSTPFFDDICKKASDGTTNRIRLQAERFYSQELIIPELQDQHLILKKLQHVSSRVNILKTEYQFQHNQLENLNQAILQEAVLGKLVKQNRADEPASELLKRIKNEKVKSGKREKPLSSIKPEEIPYKIPENWIWCRLGEIIDMIYGDSLTKADCIEGAEYAVYGSNGIVGYYDKYLTAKRTIIVGRKGSAGALNMCKTPSWTTDVAYYIEESQFLNFEFTYYLLKSLKLEELGKGIKPGVNRNEVYNILAPLPPLSEQKRIVAELEKQFAKTKRLKEHIVANQQATEQLLKALLHDTFEVEKVKESDSEGKVVELKPTNIDYYRRTVLAAEIVCQLHKEPTLGHLKLQKLVYLCQKSIDMQLPTNFLRQAMGPYDNSLMRSIDKQLKEKKWFEYRKDQALKYQPLEKAGQHHNDFLKYFPVERESIQFMIDKFKTIKSEIIEIVATLYACLDKIVSTKTIFSEALLLKEFYEWSAEKKKFKEQEVLRVFSRMRDTGIVPKGFAACSSSNNLPMFS